MNTFLSLSKIPKILHLIGPFFFFPSGHSCTQLTYTTTRDSALRGVEHAIPNMHFYKANNLTAEPTPCMLVGLFLVNKYFALGFRYFEGPKRAIKWATAKLTDKGFVYKYDLKMILDDCIRCARRMGEL